MNTELETLIANNENLSHLSDGEMIDFCDKMNDLLEGMSKDDLDDFLTILKESYPVEIIESPI
jgi:uncharacterized protein YjiK